MPYASGLGASLGATTEGTVGTETTGSMGFYEFLSESLTQTPTYLDSAGLKQGQAFKRIQRTQISRYDVGGDITLEHFDRGFSAASGRGMGFWWKHALGSTAAPTQVGTGTAYQQLHTPGTKDGLSMTVQIGRPQAASPYTSNPFTYSGCKVSTWEFTCSDGQLAQLKVTIDGWKENTATSLISPTYAGTGYQAGIFSFADVGANAFATGTSAATGASGMTLSGSGAIATVVKGITITGTTELAGDRYGFGNAGRKREQLMNGIPTITGSLDAEFTNRTEFYDLFQANTTSAMQVSFTHYLNGVDAAGASGGTGANPYRLQFTLPAVKFKSGAANVGGPDIIQQSIGFEAYDDGGGIPIEVRLVSQDQAV
jgi:hypothetical protein